MMPTIAAVLLRNASIDTLAASALATVTPGGPDAAGAVVRALVEHLTSV